VGLDGKSAVVGEWNWAVVEPPRGGRRQLSEGNTEIEVLPPVAAATLKPIFQGPVIAVKEMRCER
jgi:hypothetical protein